jgi:hypothetical protein
MDVILTTVRNNHNVVLQHLPVGELNAESRLRLLIDEASLADGVRQDFALGIACDTLRQESTKNTLNIIRDQLI